MHDLERWRGKTALVTGASSGIGEATARALGSAGLRVALAARRADRLAALERELAEAGTEAMAVTADVSRAADVRSLFAAVRERWGAVDVLINNAGTGRNAPFEALEPAHLEAMLDVNLRGAALCLHEALAGMGGKRDAAIINISSVAAHRIHPGRELTFYSATKHGLRGLTEAVRMELAMAGSPVKLGMISPGVVDSEFYARATDTEGPYEHAFEPLQPADIADIVLYMLARPRHVQINDVILRPIGQVT